MTRAEFLDEFAALLDLPPATLTPELVLSSVEAWESVAFLSLLVLIDERLGVAVRPETLSGAVTFGDLLAIVEPGFEA